MAKSISVPWSSKKENLHYQHIYHEPGTERVVRFLFSTPGIGDTKTGAKAYKMWYQISTDGGKTYGKLKQIIEQGAKFNKLHPIRPVWILKNSYVASIPPPSRASNGEIMVPFWFWPLNAKGELAHEKDVYVFCAAGVLIGDWTQDKQGNWDVIWHLGQTVHLNFDTQSTRGAMEPAIIELDTPGHFLMIMRASNAKNTSIPSYKWKCVSTDYCRTWSAPTPLTYSNGKPFFSPSACSVIMRSSKDGKIYWFGNICPNNANGNYPRYPLVVGQIDEKTLGLKKDTIRVIDTRDPSKGDSEKVQFSNFHVKENPENGNFIITLSRLDGGKLKHGNRWSDQKWPHMRYVVPLHGKIKTTIDK